MAKLITKCPSCRNSKVQVTSIDCLECGTKFEGNFSVPEILQLSEEDLDFIQKFVKSSGSLKEMSRIYNVSYPTMRNNLNSIIEQLENLSQSSVSKRDEVITALENGKITAREAAALLEKL